MAVVRRIEPFHHRQLPERRRHERQLALLRVALLHAGGSSDICVVKNISPTGLSARAYRPHATGEQVEIEFRSGELLRKPMFALLFCANHNGPVQLRKGGSDVVIGQMLGPGLAEFARKFERMDDANPVFSQKLDRFVFRVG